MQSTEQTPKFIPRTLEFVEREMANGFSYDQIKYVYHLITGRTEQAESYLQAIRAEQAARVSELSFTNPKTGRIELSIDVDEDVEELKDPKEPIVDESIVEIKM